MAGFFDRMLGRNKGSSSTAKDRLKFVLIHDRIDLPPERLRQMKEEILAVISKYVSVDRDKVDIALEQRDRDSKIVAEIPFVKGKTVTGDEDENADKKPTPVKQEAGKLTFEIETSPAKESDDTQSTESAAPKPSTSDNSEPPESGDSDEHDKKDAD